MKQCPCCDKNSLEDDPVRNSLSHVDNVTYICNDCGQKESFINLNPQMVDKIDVDIYERFKERVKNGQV